MSEAGALAPMPSRNVGETPPSGPGPAIAYGTAAPTAGAGAPPAGAAPALTDVAARRCRGHGRRHRRHRRQALGPRHRSRPGGGRPGAGAGAGAGAGSLWRVQILVDARPIMQRQKYRSSEDHRPRGPAEWLSDRLVGDERRAALPKTGCQSHPRKLVRKSLRSRRWLAKELPHEVEDRLEEILEEPYQLLQEIRDGVGERSVRHRHPRQSTCAADLLGVGRRRTRLADTGSEQERRRRGRRCRGHRGTRHRLIGAHRRRGLDPHPDVVGFVERDRDGVDPEEVRAPSARRGWRG